MYKWFMYNGTNKGRKFSGLTCQNALQIHCTITWFQSMSIEQPRSVRSDSYVLHVAVLIEMYMHEQETSC